MHRQVIKKSSERLKLKKILEIVLKKRGYLDSLGAGVEAANGVIDKL